MYVIVILYAICVVTDFFVFCFFCLFLFFNNCNNSDALTVGISFIILLEIDNKMYDFVVNNFDNKNKIFDAIKYEYSLNKNDIKYTIYEIFSSSKLNTLLLINTIICLIFETIYWNSFYYKYKLTASDNFFHFFCAFVIGACVYGWPMAIAMFYVVLAWITRCKKYN